MVTVNSDLVSTRCKERHSKAKTSCLVSGVFQLSGKRDHSVVSRWGGMEWWQKAQAAVRFLSGRNISHVFPGSCHWGGELILS